MVKGWRFIIESGGVERALLVALSDEKKATAIALQNATGGSILSRSALSDDDYAKLGLLEGQVIAGAANANRA